MGVKQTTMLTREPKIPRGGLTATDLFRLKLTKTSAAVVIAGIVALSSIGMPGKANAMDFGRAVDSAVETLSRRAINKASDSLFGIVGGVITGRDMENGARNQREMERAVEKQRREALEDLKNELAARRLPLNNVRIEMDNSGRVTMRGIVPDEGVKQTALQIAGKYSRNREVIDRMFVRLPDTAQSQTSHRRQGL